MVKYLFDANTFITPHRLYYSHDIVPSFWRWLDQNYANNIFLIDKVRDELTINQFRQNMSTNSEEIKKQMKESEEFKDAYEQEEIKLDLADLLFELRG